MKISSNFYEINTTKQVLLVPYLKFEGIDKLRLLERKYRDTVFMHSRDKLFFWGKNDLPTQRTEKITSTSSLISNVLARSFLHQFFGQKKYLIGKKMHTYKITLIDQELYAGRFKGLSLFKTFYLHFFPFEIGTSKRLGFTISYSISTRISWSIEDFKNANLEYEDLIHDNKTGFVLTNPQSKYRLANHFNYASQLKYEIDKQNAIQHEFDEINNFVDKHFVQNLDNIVLPNDLHIKGIKQVNIKLDESEDGVEAMVLQKPRRYFYNGISIGNLNSVARRMINSNKPFSFDDFENRDISLSIIFPKSAYPDVGNFFKAIQRELITTFKLKQESFNYNPIRIEDFDLASYQKAMPMVKNTDLVVVVVDKSHETLMPHESPYYFCKAEFIKRGINTQEIQIQQIKKFLSDKAESQINYTDHNIALNIYAKLGGMAWTIKPSEPRNELVFGIGATTDKNGRPVLGLTSLFRGDGKYLFGKVSTVSNMENYSNSLEKIVTSAIESSINDGILDTSLPFHLIFHIFKPAGKDNEIKALENALKRFSRYSFKHVFVHIGRGHNYRFFMYDGQEESPQFRVNKRGFGQNLRGTLIKINDRRAFLGLQQYNSVFYKIDVHEDSTFTDLNYISQQIYQFTEMSHTSYNQQGTPITIKYSNLMASFAEKFRQGNLMYGGITEITMPDNSLWFI